MTGDGRPRTPRGKSEKEAGAYPWRRPLMGGRRRPTECCRARARRQGMKVARSTRRDFPAAARGNVPAAARTVRPPTRDAAAAKNNKETTHAAQGLKYYNIVIVFIIDKISKRSLRTVYNIVLCIIYYNMRTLIIIIIQVFWVA